jgi:hypothetical protein
MGTLEMNNRDSNVVTAELGVPTHLNGGLFEVTICNLKRQV